MKLHMLVIRMSTILTRGSWMALALWLISSMALASRSNRGRPEEGLLIITIIVFFSLLAARVLLSAWLQPQRRESLVALALGIALWAIGSAMLNSGSAVAEAPFPARGEGFFLLSYLAFTCSVLLEGRPRVSSSKYVAGLWLDTTILCGSAACLVGVLALAPSLRIFGGSQSALLMALMYPVLEAILASLLLIQVVRGEGRQMRRKGLIIAGFLLLAGADSSFVWDARAGLYPSNHLLDLVYAIGFGVIVTGSCRTDPAPSSADMRPVGAKYLLIASVVPLCVLVIRPTGEAAGYFIVPAAGTVVAVFARYALSIRDGRRVAEAVTLSNTDDLTGLSNRRHFVEELTRLFAEGRPLSVMLMDLDRFKHINDTHGHDAGDHVLQVVARRLPASFEPGCTVARLGGDEFAFLVPHGQEQDLLESAYRVRSSLSAGTGDAAGISISTSIGIAIRSDSDRVASELLKRADTSMYRAKASGTGVSLHDSTRGGTSLQRARRHDPGATEENRRLKICYQPRFDAMSQQVTEIEARPNWQPERAGVDQALLIQSIETIISDMSNWRNLGVSVPVILSLPAERLPENILESGGLVVPRLGQFPSDLLSLGMRESNLVKYRDEGTAVLASARRLGLAATITEFGDRVGSLLLLRDCSADRLWISSNFTEVALENSRGYSSMKCAVRLAHELGMRVILECVSIKSTISALEEIGVDEILLPRSSHFESDGDIREALAVTEQASMSPRGSRRTSVTRPHEGQS
jgi:diguanylate cyclase